MDDVLVCKKEKYCEIFINGTTTILDYLNFPQIKDMTDAEIVEIYNNGF